jgi:SAM-dependent methyltransferase
MKRRLIKIALYLFAFLFVLSAGLTIWHYPRTTDPVAVRTVSDEDYRRFYERSYAAPGSKEAAAEPGPASSYDVRKETPPALDESPEAAGIRAFVKDYGLQDKKVLDIGSGQGGLQDAVADYTGLDISSTAARFYHKPFVVGSATELPFADNSFDAVWTIDVLEHVPRPERALAEMRRVLRPDGYLYIKAAWDCRYWAAEGYAVRPYRDFTFGGQVLKASIPIQDSKPFRALYILPIRLIRLASLALDPGPTVFRYNELRPNYERYWVPDADAVNSMDAFEAILWFTSRGDQCLSHPSRFSQFTIRSNPIIFQVKK